MRVKEARGFIVGQRYQLQKPGRLAKWVFLYGNTTSEESVPLSAGTVLTLMGITETQTRYATKYDLRWADAEGVSHKDGYWDLLPKDELARTPQKGLVKSL
jgi:hypothetical protein